MSLDPTVKSNAVMYEEDRRYKGPMDMGGASAMTARPQGMVVMQQPGAQPGMVPGVAMVQMAPQSLEALAPHMEINVAAFRNSTMDGYKHYQVSSVAGMVSR